MECLKEYYLQQDQERYLLFHFTSYLSFCLWCGAILPGIAITVRRLRDAGCNWLYIFIPLIPFVGIFILIFLLCQPTKVEVPSNNVDNPQQ